MLCPSEDELLDDSANRMGVSDQGRLSFHIATCVVCAEALEALRDEVVDEFVGRQVGNYVVRDPRRPGAPKPLGATQREPSGVRTLTPRLSPKREVPSAAQGDYNRAVRTGTTPFSRRKERQSF